MANNKNRSGGRFGRFNRGGSGITKNTVFDSTGPCGRMRGTASQLIEKYMAAAKEIRHNDRVLSEVLLQHADHYARLLALATQGEIRMEFEPRSVPVETMPESTDTEGAVFSGQEDQLPDETLKTENESMSQPEAAVLKDLPFMEVPVIPEKKTRRRLTLSKITKNQETENS